MSIHSFSYPPSRGRVRPPNRAIPCCCPPIPAISKLRSDCGTTCSAASRALHSPDESDGLDVDRFDEHCDHLLVREEDSGELVGCYRMLSPTGAIAAGGLYTATEFDIRALDSLRPSLVEMGRAVVRDGHRNGARRAVDVGRHPGLPGSLRLRLRHRMRVGADRRGRRIRPGHPDSRRTRLRVAPARRPGRYRVHPRRPVIIDGTPARRNRAARAAGDTAADAWLPAAGRGDLRRAGPRPRLRRRGFRGLLDKRQADTRYLRRLRSVSAAAEAAGRVA